MVGLRERLAAHTKSFIENKDFFGVDLTLTAPNGVSKPLVGSSTDIFRMYDNDEGSFSLRTASVTLVVSSILEAGLPAIPEGVHKSDSKPWVVVVEDIDGVSWTFKIRETNPDRAAGVVVCHLETWVTP